MAPNLALTVGASHMHRVHDPCLSVRPAAEVMTQSEKERMPRLCCHGGVRRGSAHAQVSFFKKRLMFCVAGLDRGFAANVAAVKDTEAAIYSLVGAAGGAPALSYQTPEGPPSL